MRKNIAERLAIQQYSFTKAIHPSAYIAEGVSIGDGSVVMANSVISVDASLGKHVIINTGATVEHDCKVADYVHVAPSCVLCGDVVIKTGVLLGTGTKAIPGRHVGAWTICGAGSIVIKDVPARCVAYGVPTVPRRRRTELSVCDRVKSQIA